MSLKETERAPCAPWMPGRGAAGQDSLMGLPSEHWVFNKGRCGVLAGDGKYFANQQIGCD